MSSLPVIIFALLSSIASSIESQPSSNNIDDAFANLLADPYNGYQANEVINKSPIELLELRGFEAENHYATTKDGYMINIVRIINKALPKGFKLRRPVLFNHGPLLSATIWLINSRNFKPMDFSQDRCNLNSTSTDDDGFDRYLNGPMMLSNAGHDVYLMSMRGTEFSQNHTSLNSSDPKFWDFSLDECSSRDLTAVLSYITDTTGSEKVGYIGHSQATFEVFALLSRQPEYSETIEPVIALSPVAYFDHISSILRDPLINEAENKPDTDNGPFPADAAEIREAQGQACANFRGATTCTFAYAQVLGLGEHWPRGFFTHTPFQTSRKVLRHFGQLIVGKQFAMYDYGISGNVKRYGQPTAPRYPIENIRSRSMCLFSAKSDAFSRPKDIKNFVGQLRVPLMKFVQIGYGHNQADFITGQDAGEMVFKTILGIFNIADGICY